MHFRGLDLNLLVALDVLLREQNVTRAAERMHISQPSMSAALQKLRWHFSDDLLERIGRRLELTPRARQLVDPLREILLRTDELLNADTRFEPKNAKRTFRLQMSNLCSELLAPVIMRKLARSAPNVSCHLIDITPDALTRLNEGESDFCVTIAQRTLIDPNAHEEALKEQLLFEDRLVVVSSADNSQMTSEITYEQFCRLPYVEVRFAGSVVGIVEATLRRQKLKPNTRVRVSNYLQAASVVSGSPFVAILPERLVDKFADGLNLIKWAPPIAFPELEETMIWHSRNDLDLGHRWFRAIFIEAAQEVANLC